MEADIFPNVARCAFHTFSHFPCLAFSQIAIATFAFRGIAFNTN